VAPELLPDQNGHQCSQNAPQCAQNAPECTQTRPQCAHQMMPAAVRLPNPLEAPCGTSWQRAVAAAWAAVASRRLRTYLGRRVSAALMWISLSPQYHSSSTSCFMFYVLGVGLGFGFGVGWHWDLRCGGMGWQGAWGGERHRQGAGSNASAVAP